MNDDLPNSGNGVPPSVDPPAQTPDPVIEAHSQTAQHEQRDSHGRFIHEGSTPPPNLPNSSNIPNLPQPIQVTQGGGSSDKGKGKDNETLVDVKVNNPFASFFNWIKKLIMHEGINIKIKPLTAIGMIAIAGASYGTGYHVGLSDAAKIFFPNSSPILHRSVSYQGVVQKSQSGQYYLTLPDNTLWTLKPTSTNINLSNMTGKQVLIKGNLTAEQNVVEVKEVLTFSQNLPNLPIPSTPSAQTY